MRVLILSGGISAEREVSLRSGKAVDEALRAAGYETRQFDPADPTGSLTDAIKGCDIVFPALHGTGGEDGTIQTQLEHLNIPYVGSGIYTSELCFDKWKYRNLLIDHGIAVAAGELVDAQGFAISPLIDQPFVLKPQMGGSSIDTILVRDPENYDYSTIDSVFAKYPTLLLERLIDGTELTVGVVGKKALPVIEIIPPQGAEFDYENKYNGATQELCPPKHISAQHQKQAQELALRIHNLCGCQEMSRTDMMLTDSGDLFVLETNTIPGLTDQSLLPKAAKLAGMDMKKLVKKLIKDAL